MKKAFPLSLILLCCFLSLKAQLPTYGQIYDYNEGDIIQWKFSYGHMSGQPSETFSIKTILKKYYSPAKDTVFYQVKLEERSVEHNGWHTEETKLEYYTSLDSIIPGYLKHSDCSRDTSYTDYCGRRVWKIETIPFKPNDPCYPVYKSGWVVEGIGSFFSEEDTEEGFSRWEELVFYQKGEKSCGTLFLGMDDRGTKSDLLIYPNPAQDKLYCNLPEAGNYSIQIIDLAGKIRYENEFAYGQTCTISTIGLSNGVYVVEVVQDGKRYFSKLVVMH